MTTLDGFKYECENGNRDLLLAMADEAEERGEDKLARGFRWLHHNRKWPVAVNRGPFGWCWMILPTKMDNYYGSVLPPHKAFQRADDDDSTVKVAFYKTCYEALEAAALAFWPRWKKGRKPRT